MAEPTFSQRVRYALQSVGQRQRAMTQPQRRAVAVVVSVLVAFLLWFTFSLREQYTVVVEMPVEIGRLPEGRALTERPPPAVRVAVQGMGLELMRLRRSPPPLVIHATEEQVDVFAVASESPRLPPGVSVQSVSPSVIHLRTDPELTRRMPVQLINEVEPARDHDFLGAPRVRPDSVTVAGARSLVQALDAFPTAPLLRQNAREPVQTRVALSDTLQGLVRTNVAYVEVTVPVAPFTEGVRDIEVRVEGAPEGAPQVSLLPPRVRATFRVPVEEYDRVLREPEFYAFVPYESVAADTTGTLQPIVQLPADLTVRDVRLDPRRIRYWLRVD